MNNLHFRKAQKSDMDWLYETFKLTMQDYITRTWGWDELFQHHGFHDNLPPSSFSIASLENADIGACSVLERQDHLWLEMVLVLPEKQNAGLGSVLLKNVQQSALKKGKNVRLSVLKLNPALRFYQRLGFRVISEDQWSYKMEWSHSHGL
ncbi:MAG: GNAT family N-acetyltransferase [Gammaproteobacteria bacterium]|nr:GNAT family N-acetyltransferase [Gammaproteobacteria bacterium]MDP2142406.1 GNAT family N-acetyltransferase [Gammaproteobacteria bacterium]MDP2348647.1 GNAT family N-acetyltransferase [Gammaproteobacteria bacterium]